MKSIEEFRLKYQSHISDIGVFLELIKTMKPKDVADYYASSLNGFVSLKEFIDDVLLITPELKGKKGWNYENIKKHRFLRAIKQPTTTDIMTEEQCRVEELLKRLYFVFENADKPLSHICSGISDVEIMSNILTFDTRLYDVNADTCLKAFEDALESGNKCFFNAVFEYRKDVKFISFLEFYGLRIGLRISGGEKLMVPVLHTLAVDMRQFHSRWEKWKSYI